MFTSNIIKNFFFLFFINNCCSLLKDKWHNTTAQNQRLVELKFIMSGIMSFNVKLFFFKEHRKKQVNKKDNRFISFSLNFKKREKFQKNAQIRWMSLKFKYKILYCCYPVVYHMFVLGHKLNKISTFCHVS